MNKNVVYQLLVATYQSDANVQKEAELNIQRIEGHDGFIQLVLQILASDDLELDARQAAAIYFKNRLLKSWDRSNQTAIPISEQDRNVVQQLILRIMVSAPPAIRVQLTSCLNIILKDDFHHHWTHFIGELETLLGSCDMSLVYVGLLAFREMVKVYQLKISEKRQPLENMIGLIFPTIQTVGINIGTSNDLETADMLKLVLKIYYSGIRIELPEYLQDRSSLDSWITLFLQVVAKPIPLDALPTDAEERENYPWGKTKKWAYYCLNQLFGKYGNLAMMNLNKNDYLSFAKNFTNNVAPNILQIYIIQLDDWVKNKIWISRKCLGSMAAFFEISVKHKTTWQIIKPHTEILVAQFIFPQLCFSDQDEEIWINDPVEFVHKKVNPVEDDYSLESNVRSLLITLARDRKKHTFMDILGFTNNVLDQYLKTPDDQKNGREKDGALNMITCLSHQILDSKSTVADRMELFFVTHVFPEFKSRFPYLRARACDMTKHFIYLNFVDKWNLATLCQNLLDCLLDTELPVKIQAALALQLMIRHGNVCKSIAPSIPLIMQELLKLTSEIDIDLLTSMMQDIVQVFADQLTPFSVQICTQLGNTFLRMMEDDGAAGDFGDIDNKTLTATGILKTIGILVLSLESTPNTLQQLENALLPVITYTLKNKIVDLYSETFEIIDWCTFSARYVSPTMWGVFDLIYEVFHDTDIDYIDEMLPSLNNYIHYGHNILVTNENIQRMMFDIIDNLMKNDELDEKDRVCACKLMESILVNCRGEVDTCVGPFLNLAFQFIFSNSMKTIEFKIHCIEVVINCLFDNPIQTLRFLEEKGWTQGFFTLWFSSLHKFARVHDKKLVIIALCSLIELPLDQVPETLRSGWSQLLVGIINVFRTLPKAMENRGNLEKLYIFGFDDEALYGDDFGASGDVENDDEDVYYQRHQPVGNFMGYLTQQASLHTTDNDEEEIEEEIFSESPLDDINPYLRFEQVFRTIQKNNPKSYSLLTENLNPDQRNLIMLITSIAEQQRIQQQQQLHA